MKFLGNMMKKEGLENWTLTEISECFRGSRGKQRKPTSRAYMYGMQTNRVEATVKSLILIIATKNRKKLWNTLTNHVL